MIGKKVAVTGAAHGIGAATARLFAARGADVALCDLDTRALQQMERELRAEGASVVAVTVDVGDAESVTECAAECRARLDGIDIVHVNAASIAQHGTVLDTEPDDWDSTIRVNVRGAYLTARSFLPHLIEQRRGVFCFTGSDTTHRTPRRYAAYLTSKHALIGLARSVAVDFGAVGIRSNLVSPGATDTPGLQRLYGEAGIGYEEAVDKIVGHSVLPRIAAPGDIAEAVLFLCSDAARHVTGTDFVVDGGLTVVYEAE